MNCGRLRGLLAKPRKQPTVHILFPVIQGIYNLPKWSSGLVTCLTSVKRENCSFWPWQDYTEVILYVNQKKWPLEVDSIAANVWNHPATQ